MSAVGIAASGTFVPNGAGATLGLESARGASDLAHAETTPIEYIEDRITKSSPHALGDALDARIAKVRCYNCGSTCEIPQRQDRATQEWTPEPGPQLAKFGWQTNGTHWYCGKWCAMKVDQQIRAGHKVQPVLQVEDRSYQKARALYAEQTTPARPPQTHATKKR